MKEMRTGIVENICFRSCVILGLILFALGMAHFQFASAKGFLGLGADGWTAIFTGALVCSAIVQGHFIISANRVAEEAAKAAKKSADSLQASESAFVVEEIYTPGGINDFPFTFHLRTPVPTSVEPAAITGAIVFKNWGKTPATVICYGTRFHVGEVRPHFLSMDDKYLLRYVIEAQGKTEGIYISDVIPNSTQQSERLSAGALTLWLVGFIKFADVFGKKRIRHFAWRYERPMKCFVPLDFFITEE